MQQSIDLYDLKFPERARWINGDQYLRPLVRKLLRPLRGRGPGGLAKVTHNLVLGLKKLHVPHRLHRHPTRPKPGALVGIIHGPIAACQVISREHACVLGPGIMNSPHEWPDLFTTTRARYLLQACEWAADMYRPVFGDHVRIWPVGIDDARYAPRADDPKRFDFLVYDKIRWPERPACPGLLESCLEALQRQGCTYQYIRYGYYPRGREEAFHEMLRDSRAMLFLCENETQGIAYNEALSMGVPMLAWNLGKWWDPLRYQYGLGDVPATSVPYWDDRCGLTFRGPEDFSERLGLFLEQQRAGRYAPRDYILENLTLEKCTRHYLELCEEVAATP